MEVGSKRCSGCHLMHTKHGSSFCIRLNVKIFIEKQKNTNKVNPPHIALYTLWLLICFCSHRFHVLEQSDSIDNIGGVSWRLALCLLFAWLIVFVVLLRGIKSLGKVWIVDIVKHFNHANAILSYIIPQHELNHTKPIS